MHRKFSRRESLCLSFFSYDFQFGKLIFIMVSFTKLVFYGECSYFLCSVVNFFGKVMGPKYDGLYLRSLIKRLLGDITLKQTLTQVVIPAFDIKLLQPVIFTTIDV